MSQLAALKKAQSLSDVAALLGFTPKGLAYVLYHLPNSTKYRAFDIPKKSGGTRTIKAPVPQLALAQSRLSELLSTCAKELSLNQPRFWAASHGFRKGRTIVSNANVHRKRRYVFNIDIADFFGTINFGRVRGFFIKDKSFALDPAVATVVAQIACDENALPQGSPCSPIISNYVAGILDARLMRLAKYARCTYSRYADDLTFSTNEQLFPPEIAERLAGAEWRVGDRLQQLIESTGFRLNLAKTRMSMRRSRQSVTGLVVNSKVNIRQDYYRSVRAMCNSLFNSGQWHRPLLGESEPPTMTSSLRPLEGMLSYIHFVKTRRDRTSKQNKQIGFVPPRAPVELYRCLLFYKHFVANSLPIVVTEGVSDITYIRCAVETLAAKFPILAKNQNGAASISFLNPSGTARAVLNLGQGASGQAALVESYDRHLKHYRHLPLLNPVIILCDNDDGPAQVFKNATKKSGKTVSRVTSDTFYHLGHNLYLVKVPEGTPAGTRDIEDLFPPEWLAKVVDGKSFDKKKEHADATAYGKVVLAEKVIKPNIALIDFTAFEELLERISGCIADYQSKVRAMSSTPTVTAKSA